LLRARLQTSKTGPRVRVPPPRYEGLTLLGPQSEDTEQPLIAPAVIAFSQPFLTANRDTRVTRDVSFGVATLKAGASHAFTPSEGTTRLFAVAAGKVRVDVAGRAEFTIGAHGLWQLGPDDSCSVRNPLYSDAVLHITTVPDF
jgi:hypothetical protein